MAGRTGQSEELTRAVLLAQNGAWDEAHSLVQLMDDNAIACWLHGVLHKIEGDHVNARYWYARCNHEFEDFSDNEIELLAIHDLLAEESTSRS